MSLYLLATRNAHKYSGNGGSGEFLSLPQKDADRYSRSGGQGAGALLWPEVSLPHRLPLPLTLTFFLPFLPQCSPSL